jgi:hypothetical protein
MNNKSATPNVQTNQAPKKSKKRSVMKGMLLATVATCAIAAGDAFAVRAGDIDSCIALECPNGCTSQTTCEYSWWDIFGLFGKCTSRASCA